MKIALYKTMMDKFKKRIPFGKPAAVAKDKK